MRAARFTPRGLFVSWRSRNPLVQKKMRLAVVGAVVLPGRWGMRIWLSLLLAGILTGQQGTLRFLPDEPGVIRLYKFGAFSPADLRRLGGTAADAKTFEANVKQIADVFRDSPVWNPPRGVDVLVSGQAVVPSIVRKNQPLAAGLLVGSFEHLQIKEANGTLGGKFVAGETTLLVVDVNQLPTAGGTVASLRDEGGAFLKIPSRTAEMNGFPVYGDLLVITAPGR